MKKYALFPLIILITSISSFSQTLPAGFIPLEHNGSFAGMADEGRLTLNMGQTFNNSLGGEGPNAYGYYASYDKFFKFLSTGVGLTAYSFKYDRRNTGYGSLNDSASSSQDYFFEDTINFQQKYKGTYAALSIAPKISFKGRYTISPSIKLTYGLGQLGLMRDGSELYHQDLENLNLTAGLAFNTSKYYIGYAVRLYGKDEVNFDTNTGVQRENARSTAAFYSVLEGGYSFHRENSKFSFTPQIALYIASEYYNGNHVPELDLSLRFQYSHFLFGHSINNRIGGYSGLRFLSYIGWQKDSFRVLIMSNDEFTEWDLNLRFMIPNKSKKRSPMFW